MRFTFHLHNRYPLQALLGLLLMATLWGQSSTATPANTDIFGPSLNEPIISVYVPPTRPGEPIVATSKTVYIWDPASEGWSAIYTPPWKEASILSIGGYAKSSKVIYIAHSGGVARSGDGGDSWTEARPYNFPSDLHDARIDILVDPNAREHAVLLAQGAGWETIDYGLTWLPIRSKLSGTNKTGKLSGGFIRGTEADQPLFLLSSSSAIHLLKGSPLEWQASWTAPRALNTVILHKRQPDALLCFQDGKTAMATLSTDPLAFSSAPLSLQADGLYGFIGSGNSAAWETSGNQLGIRIFLNGETLHTVANFVSAVGATCPHPDLPDALYAAVERQLYFITGAFAGLPAESIAQTDLHQSQGVTQWPTSLPEKLPEPSPSPSHENASLEARLQALLDSQPPFQTIQEAAVFHAEGAPADFQKWERFARKRNWLPELRIEGGVREKNTDNNFLYEPVDRYGIVGDPEDLNLPDRIQSMGFAAIVLKWDLHNLLFDGDQVDIIRERRYSHKYKRDLVEDLSRLYYGRIRKLAERDGLFGPVSPEQTISLTLEIEEMTAVLNGYCGTNLLK
jgi:hypothetical protein